MASQKNDELNSELNIVYRYLRKKGIPQTDAEDAVQEAAYRYYFTVIQSRAQKYVVG